jgi:hypothetical protein
MRPISFALLFSLLATPWLAATDPIATPVELLYRADFTAGLDDWVIEQQPGGNVTVDQGTLFIDDKAGCTVWLRHRLEGPVFIRFQVTMESSGRVSDLNCFWMASDPQHATDLFYDGHLRTGKFSTYDPLQLYYVGYGGKTNSTTRFRRYDGRGNRPLDPSHDLTTPPYLLHPDHRYTIELIAAGGRAQYLRDGEIVFDFVDAEPLVSGWFGFRTVKSHYRVHDVEIWRAEVVE